MTYAISGSSTTPRPILSISSPVAVDANAINFHTSDDEIMLKITKDGFYVRGVKVDQDEHEAAKVYDSFKKWLEWAHLSR